MDKTGDGRVLFQISFASAMGPRDLGGLRLALDLSTNPRSDVTHAGDCLGFARLDHYSGVFLTRGATEDHWLLQARTWGRPAADTVHGWQVLAGGAAQALDPAVILPARSPVSRPEPPDRRVGAAANKRLTAFRRRLVGLS